MDLKKVNPDKITKQFCDYVSGGFTNEIFVMIVSVGNNNIPYTLTLEHAKRLSQWLSYQLEEFEKNVKKIDTEWTPNIKSPIQAADLSGNSDTDGNSEKKPQK